MWAWCLGTADPKIKMIYSLSGCYKLKFSLMFTQLFFYIQWKWKGKRAVELKATKRIRDS